MQIHVFDKGPASYAPGAFVSRLTIERIGRGQGRTPLHTESRQEGVGVLAEHAHQHRGARNDTNRASSQLICNDGERVGGGGQSEHEARDTS